VTWAKARAGTSVISAASSVSSSSASSAASSSAGTGIAADPYRIYDCVQLQAISQLAANYLVMNDIDCSDSVNWNGGLGFTPIAGTFTGTFDGGNHLINGLTINRPSYDYVGLFEHLGSLNGQAATITNLNLRTISFNGRNYMGGIAAIVDGTNVSVTNSSVTGAMTFGSAGGYGGLFGNFVGGTISKAWSNVAMNVYAGGTSNNIGMGGIIGGGGNAIVSNSYSLGAMPAAGTCSYVCFAGGIAGITTNTVISNSYAVGSNTANYGGGIVAQFSSGMTCTNSYFDSQTTGISSSTCGTAETTALMKQQVTYTTYPSNWDFSSVWQILAGGYPTLR